jgi:protein-L-isoaspartate(D-aspartate) O-methyltransferase
MGVKPSLAQSEHAQVQLVASLREEGAISSDQVAQAFLTIPREAFVPFFYQQEGLLWAKRIPEAYDANAWLSIMYQADQPLVTFLDSRNWPSSSSSAPAAMAVMLEALELKPGMRVLEIGTGSGYNAALLAQIVGDPALVTTIEIEESLAHSAAQALQKQVGPVSVHIGDGRLGVPERAPYDRIIATASATSLPHAWYGQLVSGGRLVMVLQGSLGQSGFLVLEKINRAMWKFDPRPLYFMPLRPGDDLLTRPVSRLLREPVTREVVFPDDEMATTLLQNDAFHWFLQWYTPGISLAPSLQAKKPFITLVDATKATLLQLYLSDGQWSGHQHGGTGLWETVEQAYVRWHRLGKPDLNAYHVAWDQPQETFRLVLEQAEQSMSFLL